MYPYTFASLHPNAGAQLRKEILLFDSLLSSNEGVYNHDTVPIVPVTDPSQVVPHLHDPISLHNQQIEHEISSSDVANSSTDEPIVDTEQQVDSAADSPSDTISADTARSDPELLLSRQAAKSGDHTSVHVTAPDRTQACVTANAPECLTTLLLACLIPTLLMRVTPCCPLAIMMILLILLVDPLLYDLLRLVCLQEVLLPLMIRDLLRLLSHLSIQDLLCPLLVSNNLWLNHAHVYKKGSKLPKFIQMALCGMVCLHLQVNLALSKKPLVTTVGNKPWWKNMMHS
jgi:hypothetical protein